MVHKYFSSIHKVLWKIPTTTYYLCFLMQKRNHRVLEAKAGRVEIKNNLPIVRVWWHLKILESCFPNTKTKPQKESISLCIHAHSTLILQHLTSNESLFPVHCQIFIILFFISKEVSWVIIVMTEIFCYL